MRIILLCIIVFMLQNVNPVVSHKSKTVKKTISKQMDPYPNSIKRYPPVKISRKQKVITGLEVLLEDADSLLKDKRIGLIVNHSSINSKGKHIIDLLHPKYKIAKIFAPEHGVRGNFDDNVSDSKDEKSGLQIISLYQGNKKAPTKEDLIDIDILIFDIQEIGVRYYTYATTMILAMKAAKENGKRIIILDRPNMAGHLGVYGPLLDKKYWGGFAGYYPIPLSHGMTIGELAAYYNEEEKIGADIQVIAMKNYSRKLFYDETGLPWRKPSPNIPDMESVIGYHLGGALERLNISVGRGTIAPFLMFGAPGINGNKLARELNKARLPGLKFEKIRFSPAFSNFKGKRCEGFRIVIRDRRKIDPMRTLITIAKQVYSALPGKEKMEHWMQVSGSIGRPEIAKAVAEDKTVESILTEIGQETTDFLKLRKKYLRYE